MFEKLERSCELQFYLQFQFLVIFPIFSNQGKGELNLILTIVNQFICPRPVNMQNNIAIDKVSCIYISFWRPLFRKVFLIAWVLTLQSYESYVETLKVKSEDLIKNVLPRKIAELNKLLDSGEFSITHQQKLLDDDLNVPIPDAPAIGPMQSPRTSALNTIDGGESDEDEDEEDEDDEGEKMAKKRKLNNGTAALTATKPQVPSSLYKCNAVISKLIDTLEPFARESLEAGKIVCMHAIFDF